MGEVPDLADPFILPHLALGDTGTEAIFVADLEGDQGLGPTENEVMGWNIHNDHTDGLALDADPEPQPEAPECRLPLIGRDRLLIQKLAKLVFKNLPHGTYTTNLRDTADRRGYAFEVQIRDEDGKPTGRIARVQVTLDRVEPAGGHG
jgi:hypothetical protein